MSVNSAIQFLSQIRKNEIAIDVNNLDMNSLLKFAHSLNFEFTMEELIKAYSIEYNLRKGTIEHIQNMPE